MMPAFALARRELVRFLRQRSRVIGALVTPVLFWLLIGFGVGDTFAAGQGGFVAYFFPGTLLMIVLFTAIFSTISVIEDRREGFLQGVLASPVARHQIVLGKVLGGTALASLQAVLFLLLAPVAGVSIPLAMLPVLLLTIVVAGFGLTSLGLLLAWPMTSTQGFHVMMNLLLMPMWFLSGALFPLRESLALPLKAAMLANPMTYALSAMRHALQSGDAALRAELPGMGVSLAVLVVFSVVAFLLTCVVAQRPGRVVIA